MANDITKLTNMVNPQVMADMISAELPQKLKFAPLARIDTTLVGQAGDTITIPSFQYIGDADDLTEGVAMGTVLLTTQVKSATIKEAGKAVEITDKAVNSGYGDPIGEARKQLLMSISAKADADSVTALAGGTLEHDIATAVISYNAIVDAVDKFAEEDDEPKILFIHPLQKGTLRKDPLFIANVPNAFMTGVIGELAGCQVVASSRVPRTITYTKTSDATLKTKTYYTLSDDVYTAVAEPKVANIGDYYEATGYTVNNIIVKAGALVIYLKASPNIEAERNVLKRSTILAGSQYYVAELEDDSKVVRLKTKA